MDLASTSIHAIQLHWFDFQGIQYLMHKRLDITDLLNYLTIDGQGDDGRHAEHKKRLFGRFSEPFLLADIFDQGIDYKGDDIDQNQ